MIVSIGEILFDIFPDYKVLGGAPFNFAAHCRNFGADTRFISRVGNDEEGMNIRKLVQEKGFAVDDIQIDTNYPTGRVIVTVDRGGIPTFDIVKNVAYDYIEVSEDILQKHGGHVSMIYFGTLIQRTKNGLNTVRNLLEKKNQGTVCFYDINLRPECYNKDVIEYSLHQCNILKLNDDELNMVIEMNNISGNLEEAIYKISKEFVIEMIILTKGKDGSELFINDKRYVSSSDSQISVVDSVGAGDAFSSIVAIGYLGKWSPRKILDVATAFASEICGIEGAIPENTTIYEKIAKKF